MKPLQGFREFAEDAGLGSMIWGRYSYLAAVGYHYIIGAFTACLLLVLLSRYASGSMALITTGLYLAYVALRKLLTRNPQAGRWFYGSRIQFLRAQIGLVGITALMILSPGSERTSLWVLYVLVIMLTSKHCITELMALVLVESCLALALIPALRGASLAQILANAELWANWLALGLLTFVIHYLVRNVQARSETIEAYSAVNALVSEVDMTDARGAQQWFPLLTTLAQRVDGACASTWALDRRTQQLQLVASVQRSARDANMFCLIDEAPGLTLSVDDATLIGSVARTGNPRHVLIQPNAATEGAAQASCQPLCADMCAELAMPIDVGTGEHSVIAGVLSVGFHAASFHQRLLPEYHNFMRGLVSQAKPMLASARRLEELVALQATSRQVWRSLDLDQVLKGILQAVVSGFGFEFATISLVDDDGRLIRCVQGINVPQKWLEMAVHLLDSNDIQAHVIRTGKTEVIVGWDERFDKRIWETFGHQYMVRVFMPIEASDAASQQTRNIGTIEAGYHRAEVQTIGPDQLRLLELFKNQVSMTIEHARLLQRTQKKADVLTSLHRVGYVIGLTRQPDQVLKEIARNARTLLNADLVMVYRYYRGTHTVDEPVIAGDMGNKYRLNLDLNEDNILAQLLREGKPYYSTDAQHDPHLVIYAKIERSKSPKSKPTFIQRHNIKSFAGIPLSAGGETMGIMFVNYRRRHPFDPDEQQVHELFAQQAAITIKNVEMNEISRNLVVREERHHLSRELHHSISQALFGIELKAQYALTHLHPDAALRVEFDHILEIAHIASNEIGFIIDDLRAPVEEGRYLERGLAEYTHWLTRWYGVEVGLEHDLHRLPPNMERLLMRFAREAMNNAVRHSGCRAINVRCEALAHRVFLSVSDDGIGFDPTQVAPNKLGLKSMQELAMKAGGFFQLNTRPGAGTTVSLQVYLDSDREDL
ncbi:MAG TPA: GAF domain-containing protein [Anaerolineae bacterium]|nr:GAF domain-containing protein [Anaerolineae bacterium]